MAKTIGATELIYHGPDEPEPYINTPRNLIEVDPSDPNPPSAWVRITRIYLRDLARRPASANRDGKWKIRVDHVRKMLGLSEKRWVTIRRELEARGLYRAEKTRTVKGKWEWQHHVFETPRFPHPPVSGGWGTIPPKTVDGRTTDAEVRDIRSTTPRTTTPRSSSIARTRDSVAGAAAEKPKQQGQERPSGIKCYDNDDHRKAERIEATYPCEEISDGVAVARKKLNSKGKPLQPTPGVVEAEILLARAAREQAERTKTRGGTGCSPPVPPNRSLREELQYIDQMHAYGRFTDAEREQQRVAAKSKFAGQRNEVKLAPCTTMVARH
jgi:hypothetical protein